MFKKGDVVMVIGTKSAFNSLAGAFGIVKNVDEYKCMVLFKASVCGKGSLSHTVLNTELVKIGESNFKFD